MHIRPQTAGRALLATVAAAVVAAAPLLASAHAAYPQAARTAAGGTAGGGATIPRCPRPPLPAGSKATVSGPTFLPPGQPGVAMTGPHGTVTELRGVCRWEVTAGAAAAPASGQGARAALRPHSLCPCVEMTYAGQTYMALGATYFWDANDVAGVYCNSQGDVLDGYGGGGAQAQLDSSYCNTDGTVIGEGQVQAVDVGWNYGPDIVLGEFNYAYTSFEGGNDIFYGIFQFCSEDPVGQMQDYSCYYFYGGPLF